MTSLREFAFAVSLGGMASVLYYFGGLIGKESLLWVMISHVIVGLLLVTFSRRSDGKSWGAGADWAFKRASKGRSI